MCLICGPRKQKVKKKALTVINSKELFSSCPLSVGLRKKVTKLEMLPFLCD